MRDVWAIPATIMAISVSLACAASHGVPEPTAPSEVARPGWHTYTDRASGFEVSYPDALAILPETSPLPDGVQKRVRFQDKQLSAGPFAELEPPRLTIEVASVVQPTSAGDWLRSVGRLPASASVTPATMAGATDAIHVQLRQQLAPNEFYCFATASHVYTLTPPGTYALEMVASFHLF